MRALRVLMSFLVVSLALTPARAAEETDDWKLFGSVLALAQQFVRLAAQSPDPQAMRRGIDAMLSGENAEANRLAGTVLEELLADVPPEHHAAFVWIGRDLLAIARREQARAAAHPEGESVDRAVQARKQLHAMGLRYWDEQQFLDAVRRGDRIAVDLYLAARGLESRNPPAGR